MRHVDITEVSPPPRLPLMHWLRANPIIRTGPTKATLVLLLPVCDPMDCSNNPAPPNRAEQHY